MASYSNHPQRHNIFSPETPCHPSNGYEVREEASPLNSGAGAAIQLSRKIEFERSMSNDCHERMPQDAVAANETMTLPVETVAAKTKKRRNKSADESNKTPRRRSLRLQMRESLCEGRGGMLPSVDNTNAAEISGSPMCQIKVTHDGSSALAEALTNVVTGLVGTTSEEQDEHATTDTYLFDDESSEGDTTRRRKKAKVKSVLESLEPIEKENSLNSDKVVRLSSKKRRDTLDLARRRGLRRTGAVQSSDDWLEQNNTYAASTDPKLQIDTDVTADLKPPATTIIPAADPGNETWTDMITPKNGSNEVQLPKHFAIEISTKADEQDELRGSPAVKENLRNVTSVAIEEQMRNIFSEFSVYNYVSFLFSFDLPVYAIILLIDVFFLLSCV